MEKSMADNDSLSKEKKQYPQKGISIKAMCQAAVFAAIIAVMAQISVPMAGGVPVTLQTMAVALSGVVLGSRVGTVSCLVYLLIGAAGMPVFAGFKGGIGSVLGVTGGFLISFPVLSFAAGKAAEISSGISGAKKAAVIAAGLFIGAMLNYAAGVIWFKTVSGSTIAAGIAACVAPFIVNDIIKLAIAGWAGIYLRRCLKKAGVL